VSCLASAIIRLIIQAIQWDTSGSDQIDDASNLQLLATSVLALVT
jgi:hypothetical protein